MLAVADQHLTQKLALCGVRYAHRRNVASLPPVTRNLLLRSKTQHCTASLCPDIWCWMSHLAKVRVRVRVRGRVRGSGRGRGRGRGRGLGLDIWWWMSHVCVLTKRTMPSSEPTASELPLASKAAALQGWGPAAIAAISATMRTSHSRTTPSASVEASMSPFIVHATLLTALWCPG